MGEQKDPIQIFVRVGALKRFHTLKQRTTDLPVNVAWDRRRSERREAGSTSDREGHKVERRAAPPFTWDLADFVVVEDASSPKKP